MENEKYGDYVNILDHASYLITFSSLILFKRPLCGEIFICILSYRTACHRMLKMYMGSKRTWSIP